MGEGTEAVVVTYVGILPGRIVASDHLQKRVARLRYEGGLVDESDDATLKALRRTLGFGKSSDGRTTWKTGVGMQIEHDVLALPFYEWVEYSFCYQFGVFINRNIVHIDGFESPCTGVEPFSLKLGAENVHD